MLTRLFPQCVLIIGCVCFSSLALSNPQLTYKNYPDGIGITGCENACPSDLVVPEMINGKTVTRIEEDALCYSYGNQNYDGSFSKPDSILLPNTIKHIGESAFCDLDSIVLPASVVSIYEPFSEISDIYIIRPADQNLNVFDFPADANIYACDGLNEGGIAINCEEAYPDITRSQLDYESAQALVDSNGHVEIPNTYTMIEEAAFSFGGITSITIPDSVLHIGEEAFVGNNLDSLVIPSSLISIVDGTFYGFEGNLYILRPAEQNLNVFDFPADANLYACDALNEEGIPVNCEEAYPDIVRNELDYDSALALLDVNGHLEIPNSYTMINDSALSFGGITSISLPDSIMHIPEDSLETANLVSLIIPSSVISYSDDSYLDVVGDIYIIKPADQYIDPYHLPHTSNHFVCESVDNSGNPVGCEDLWQSTISENTQFVYNIIDDGIEVTGCNGTCPNDLVIPHEIDGYIVTSIGEGAFSSKGINSVSLPNSLTKIEDYAFEYNNLANINFPENLIRIGIDAFGNNQLVTVDIPSNVSIGEGAFRENQGEKFENWNYMQIQDQILLLGCVNSCPSDLVIPNTINDLQVAFIGEEAFWEEAINSLTLPNGLLIIEDEAFAENYLSEVMVPETVTSLSPSAFKYNTGIQNEFFTYLKINSSALIIECNEPCQMDLIIPETIDGNLVKYIDDGAFENSNISALSLPDTLEYIEDGGFASNLLTTVTVPYSIIGLEGSTFSNNPLESVHFMGNRPYFDIRYGDFESSATLSLVTYCTNTTGWPGDPIEGITPQLDETCDSDNDGTINTEDAFPFDSSRNIDESSDNSNDQSEDQYAILDIDQNGSFDALTDGLILLRYAFGLRGESLIDGVVDTNANRTSASDIEVYIQTLVP